MPNKKPLLILSPMAGITDLPFRMMCKKFGANIVYSEMISAAGIYYNQEKTLAFLQTNKKEWPIYFQLFGNQPKHFAKAAEVITEKYGDGVGIDINFGCPVKKIIKQNAGCALMNNPKLSAEIVKSVAENTTLPVSIKIRAGIGNINAMEFLKKIGRDNWESIIIHGRTFRQGFSGPIDLGLIRKIKTLCPDKTVIANGGIYCPKDAKSILEKTGADGIAIGQGSLGNPWIFRQINSYLDASNYQKPDILKIKKVAIIHAKLHNACYKGKLIGFRKHLGWYFKGFPGAKNIRKFIPKVENLKDVESILKQI